MPKDNIERARKRGTGELEGGQLEEVIYEGYAPHGVGVLIEVVTDNRNRAVAEVRHAFNKQGGNMAEAGAVSWQFTRKGFISISDDFDPDEVFLVAAEAGADDIVYVDSVAEVYTELDALQHVRSALEEAGYELSEVSVIYDPNNRIDLDTQQTLQVMKLVEMLEDLDDVQNVYTSMEIGDEAMSVLATA